MRTWWGQLRASRYAGWLFGLLAAGLLLWIAALVVKAAGAEDKGLQRLANQAQVVGVALAVIPLVLNAIIGLWQRLRGVPIQRDPGELLALHVRQVEERTLDALLGDAAAANLIYNADDTVHRHDPQPDAGMLERLRRLVQYRTEHAGPEADLKSIADFYSGLESRRLVILGEPGSGKTVLAIEFILQLLNRLSDSPSGGAVPVRASLAAWDPSRPLEEWLAERLTVDYQLPPTIAKALVEERRVLPVLDGLDEMDPDPIPTQARMPPQRALAALAKLNKYQYAQGRQRPAVVVTCRQQRYSQIEQAGAGLRDATRIWILPLDAGQIRGYLTSLFHHEPDQLKAWQPVLDTLEGPAGAAAGAVLSTPWRLHLATALSQTGRPPSKLYRVEPDEDPHMAADRIQGLLLAGYVPAATQLAAKLQPGHSYDPAKVTAWLRNLALHLDWQGTLARRLTNPPPGLSGTDLLPHLLWPIGGWRRVRLQHTTFGIVFFAASLMIYLRAVLGPPAVWVDNVQRWIAGLGELPPAYLVGQFVSAVVPALFGIWLVQTCLEEWPSIPVSARQAVSLRHRLATGLMTGLAVAIFGFLLGVLALGLAYEFAVGVVGGLAAGLGAGLITGLVSAIMAGFVEWSQDADIASPRSPLRVAFAAGLGFGLAGGLMVGIAGGLVTGLTGGLSAGTAVRSAVRLTGTIASGLPVGVAVGLAFLSKVWVRYRVGLLAAATRRKVPWRFGRFLDWACSAGLLRVSGSAYQFRHLELQRWLVHQQHQPSETPIDIRS